jgi:hypothetical protein
MCPASTPSAGTDTHTYCRSVASHHHRRRRHACVPCGHTLTMNDLHCHFYAPQLRSPLDSRSSSKEIRFFSDDSRYERGLDFYHSHFTPYPPPSGSRLVDCTPDYFQRVQVRNRMVDTYAQSLEPAKFVVLMRDPVERAVSHWSMAVRSSQTFRMHDDHWAVQMVSANSCALLLLLSLKSIRLVCVRLRVLGNLFFLLQYDCHAGQACRLRTLFQAARELEI